MIELKNLTNVMQVVESADGDALCIMPMARVTTEEKFLWRLPEQKVRQLMLRQSSQVTPADITAERQISE